MGHHIRPRLEACTALTLMVSIAFTGCFDGIAWAGRPVLQAAGKAGASHIPFESIADGAPAGMLPKEPSVFLAVNAAGAAPFLKYLTEGDRLAVWRFDFSSRAVVAVFSGARGSSGHAVRVEQLARGGSTLRITARITTPRPDGYALTVFTSPYHILAVPRAALGEPLPASWILMDPVHQKTTGGRF